LFLGDGHRNKLIPNSEIDATLEPCSITMEPQARLTCIADAQALLLQNMTVVPILTNFGVFATQATMEGYGFDYLGYLNVSDTRIIE